jgi:hypothetical protein
VFEDEVVAFAELFTGVHVFPFTTGIEGYVVAATFAQIDVFTFAADAG